MPIKPTSQTLDVRFRRYYQNIAPTLKKPKMRATTTAVFSFLAVSLFLWYAVRPTAQTIIYLQRQIADKTVLNQQMESKITSLIEVQATFENISDKLVLLDTALPINPKATNLARELRNIADISQASLSAMQITSVPVVAKEATPGANLAAAPKGVQWFIINIVTTGTYTQLKTFLTTLLQLQRIVTIDQISLKSARTLKSDVNSIEMTLRLKSYYTLQ